MSPGRALHAEWTKLRTVPSTGWLLIGLVAATVAVGSAAIVTLDASRCGSGAECDPDTARLMLVGVYASQIAVVVLAVLSMSNEYATMMIRTTLAARPHRLAVYAAKAAVLTGVVTAAGVAGVLGAVAAAGVIMPGTGFPTPSLADGPTLRAAAGTVLYLGLVALLSLGIGAVARDTAGALATALSLLYVLPIVASFVTDERWRELILKYAPMTAGLAIQATEHLDALPIRPWPGLGLFGCYAAGGMVLGAVMFVARDA